MAFFLGNCGDGRHAPVAPSLRVIRCPKKTKPSLTKPAPDRPNLPLNELHIWRVRLEEPGLSANDDEDCPVERERSEQMKAALFRKDIMARYLDKNDGAMQILAGPSSGLRVAMAQCDHVALIAVSRDVRCMGLDVERVSLSGSWYTANYDGAVRP